jgi:hypothetical protein
MSELGSEQAGVYCADRDGRPERVHGYAGGDYGLADITELFELGRASEDETGHEILEISHEELDRLKALADAYSFDFDAGLIELCHDLQRYAAAVNQPHYRFWSDF